MTYGLQVATPWHGLNWILMPAHECNVYTACCRFSHIEAFAHHKLAGSLSGVASRNIHRLAGAGTGKRTDAVQRESASGGWGASAGAF